jgi:hypothetical protein
MAKTVDYILKVSTQQGNQNLKGLAKESFAAQKGLVKVTAAAAGVGVAMAAIATGVVKVAKAFIDGAKAIFDFTQQSADLVNDINDLSARSAISAENIKALQFALEASGQSASQATAIFTRFPSVLSQAKVESSRAAQGFADLDVQVFNADGSFRNANTVLEETIAALQGVEDKTTRAAIASDIFGRQAGALLQALGDSDGLESFVRLTEKFGVRTGPKASAAASKFQKNVASLDMVVKGLKSTFVEAFGDDVATLVLDLAEQVAIGSRLISIYTKELTDSFKIVIEVVKLFFGLGVELTKAFGVGLVRQIPIIGGFASDALLLADTFDVVGTAMDALINHQLPSFGENLAIARKDAAEFRKAMEDVSKATAPAGGITIGGATGAGAAVAVDAKGANANRAGVQFQLVGNTIIDGIDQSLANQFALAQQADEAFFNALNLERIGVALEKVSDSIRMISSPDGLVRGIGAAFGPIGSSIAGAIQGLAALGEKSPAQLKKEFENFAKAVAKGLAMLPALLIEILPVFVVQLAKGIGEQILKLPLLILQAFANLFQPIVDFFKGEKLKEKAQNFKENRPLLSAVARIATEGGLMSGGFVTAQSGISFTGGKRGLAMLHEGEAVVPASGRTGQAEQRTFNQAGASGINIVINSAVVENRAIDELVRRLEHRFGAFGVGKTALFNR